MGRQEKGLVRMVGILLAHPWHMSGSMELCHLRQGECASLTKQLDMHCVLDRDTKCTMHRTKVPRETLSIQSRYCGRRDTGRESLCAVRERREEPERPMDIIVQSYLLNESKWCEIKPGHWCLRDKVEQFLYEHYMETLPLDELLKGTPQKVELRTCRKPPGLPGIQ